MEWTYKSASEWFLSLEEEWGLLEYRIDDVYVWEYIRFEVHREILERLELLGRAHSEKGATFSERLRGLYLWGRNFVYKNPLFADEHSVLFFGHPRRKLEDDGLWWDPYCDPILDSMSIDYEYVEYDYQLDHASPAKTGKRRFVDVINYSGTLWKTLNTYDLNRSDINYFESIESEIEQHFDLSIDIVGKVQDALADREATYPLYRCLLKRVNPSFAVLVVSYGKESFLEACHDCGIPTVELQHGSINEFHMGYSSPIERSNHTFPDYFFSFGSFWTEQVELPIPEERVFHIGYPYLERQAKKYIHVDSKGFILFISQGSIGNPLSKFAVEVSESLGSEREVVYKLHPGEYDRWREEYPWLAESKITVIDEEEASLYRLFAEASVQIGVYSTAVYEGLMFDLQTYLVDLPGIEYMDGLLKEPHVQVVGDPSEIEVRTNEHISFDVDRFFHSSAIENAERALEEIRQNGSVIQ
jgi:hypothetical protein